VKNIFQTHGLLYSSQTKSPRPALPMASLSRTDEADERSYTLLQPHARQKKRQKIAAPFIGRLYAEVADEVAPTKCILAWDQSEDALLVKDLGALVDRFLVPGKIKPNFGAFLRLMRDFGFARRGLSFTHAHFKRGRPELLHLVQLRRRCKFPSAASTPRQISSASLVVEPLEGSEPTEKNAPLDEEVVCVTATIDEMRQTVQALYMNMVNSVTELNVAVAVLGCRVGASRPLETALAARSATGNSALDGGGQGGGGGRSNTPPFADDPPSPNSPVSVDRRLY
jgi:hypothetical protein